MKKIAAVVLALALTGCATVTEYGSIPVDDPRREACREALKADVVIAAGAAMGASPVSAAGAVAKVASRYLKGDPTLVQTCLPLILEAIERSKQ
jgi:hypothetical protein